jgi:N4-(beta-N-acetylglucosaminyl)-L-asparaginase
MKTALEPIILSTWSFGKKANAAGWPFLTGPKASSLDAVEQACRAVEADAEVHSVGRGGCPDRDGDVSLDAAIMASPARYGTVCYVRGFLHPVSIARAVMDKLNLLMLAGEGAEQFAAREGMLASDPLTDQARRMWKKWLEKHPSARTRPESALLLPNVEELEYLALPKGSVAPPEGEALPHNRFHDTVGVLAIDGGGCMAGACSTSGLPFKTPGRVGDSPIIGHGLYVDPRRGAAVATGVGELITSVCGGFLAVELMGRGAAPKDAAREVLERILDNHELAEKSQVAILALHPSGQWSAAALRPGYNTAVRTESRDELVPADAVLLT